MNLFLARHAPLVVGGLVLALLAGLLALQRWLPGTGLLDRMEWMTYDWRVRTSLPRTENLSQKLGMVVLDDAVLEQLNRSRGYTWPLPRKLYGYVVKELADQGARAAAFDIFFQDRQPESGREPAPTDEAGKPISSDEYFALQMKRAGNVLLGAPADRKGTALELPLEIFQGAAAGLGHCFAAPDADGVLRRVRPFYQDPVKGRVWQLGILLAAQDLGLDLSKAVLEPRRIVVPDRMGAAHELPLDAAGNLVVNWSFDLGSPVLRGQTLTQVLGSFARRAAGKPVASVWTDRLLVVGSVGTASNISDRGSTPVAQNTFLFLTHLNVANSILTATFVRQPGALAQIGLLAAMTFLSGLLSWRLRVLWATLSVLLLSAAYVGFAWWVFATHRVWLPIVLPVAGALLMTHASMVAFRFLLERSRRQHVKSLFGKIVSPHVIELLLAEPQVPWQPSRRMMTVFFADIRGSTKFTDDRRARAEKDVAAQGLTGDAAQRRLDAAASESLETINEYLSAVVDAVKRHHGTLDKYIGDSVMAFWGAPLPDERHAGRAVRAAMDAQRAVAELNTRRAAENQRRLATNAERVLRGLEPLPELEIPQIGAGLNSGIMSVGFMGSPDHLSNFTAFGHDVNLAARLQSIAGPGIILAGELTHQEALRQDPELENAFLSQGLAEVKGVTQPVVCYRVLWAS